jgi:hypothetical protein
MNEDTIVFFIFTYIHIQNKQYIKQKIVYRINNNYIGGNVGIDRNRDGVEVYC